MTERTTRTTPLSAVLIAASMAAFAVPARGATLEVGPGKDFTRIEQANAKAAPGDLILVYPRENGRPYEKEAVYVRRG